MQKYTQKQLRNLVASGVAVDLTNSGSNQIPEAYKQIGFAAGVYGCNGLLFRGLDSGRLYAITARTTAIFIY